MLAEAAGRESGRAGHSQPPRWPQLSASLARAGRVAAKSQQCEHGPNSSFMHFFAGITQSGSSLRCQCEPDMSLPQPVNQPLLRVARTPTPTPPCSTPSPSTAQPLNKKTSPPRDKTYTFLYHSINISLIHSISLSSFSIPKNELKFPFSFHFLF